ncbi:MAG: FAD-dependent oxidoreductase [Candidatus Neoclostridium sp.]
MTDKSALSEKKLNADLCVVGGGIAGTFAAITAARLGLKTVLIHERPVLGGNASSEIRMWICGAQQRLYREAGLQEELEIKNFYFNPTKNWYLFDSVLYDMAMSESNLTTLLNCTCFAADCENQTIKSVTAYQMTTQTLIGVSAEYFADCSGDSILAPLSGANFMYGREAAKEYGEYVIRSHEVGDDKTMGNSVLIQARNVGHKVDFIAPEWAEKVSVEKLKSKGADLKRPDENFWYIELGGCGDVIAEAETLNRRLLAICLGAWDAIKNSGRFDADDYELEFLGFLPAKRESRRMKGDYVLTANDVLNGGKFEDTVAYGGWGLDDHNPDGFDGEESNYNQPVGSVYGIPYRCLYSQNVSNLFFAGRNVSATHMATSSARVMGTCGCIGQAVGAAAFVARKYKATPRNAGEHIREIQQILLMNDCFLPNVNREVSALCREAELSVIGNAENVRRLRDGLDRNIENRDTGALIANGSEVVYEFASPKEINGVKIVFDSDLLRETVGAENECERFHSTRSNVLPDSPVMRVPTTLAKAFVLSGENERGETVTLYRTDRNLKRNLLIDVHGAYKRVGLTVIGNYGGAPETKVFTFEIF